MNDKQTPPHGMCVGCGKEHDFPVTKEMAASIGAALAGAPRDPFGGLEAALNSLFGARKEEPKHPAGAVAVTTTHPVLRLPALEWLEHGNPPPDGTYLYLGAPTVANSDQANAAVQAMGNLGYRWDVGNQSWTKPIDGLDSKMHVDGDGAPARRLAAVRTLTTLGYTYNGGPTWDAPVAEQADNLFPGQFGHADAGVVAAAPGVATSIEEDTITAHFGQVLGRMWEDDPQWSALATALGLHPADRSPAAIMAARVYMTCDIALGD